MTRILYIILFLTTLFTGCQTSYTVSEKKSGFIPVKVESQDEEINKIIQPYRDSLKDEMETVIGTSELEMKTGQPESLLGNFVCDLVKQYTYPIIKFKNQLPFPTIVLMNYRGLRGSLPKGAIKVKNIFEIMPFENMIVYADIKGTEIIKMANYLIEYGGQPVSSNFKMIVEKDKTFKITIDSKPLDSNIIYTIITTDYLLNGGDNMNFFDKVIKKTETNYKLRDLIIDEIKYNTESGLLNTSKLDGRITFK